MNMSYCRFQNTLSDLIDCDNNLPGNDLSIDEARAFADLIELCRELTEKFEGQNGRELIDLALEKNTSA